MDELKKVKVCFLIPSLDSGGIETYTLRFLHYAKSNIEPHIIVRSKIKGELYDDYMKETNNIYFQPLGYFNILNLIKYFKLFLIINPSVVVDFNANFAGIPMLIAKTVGIKSRIAFYRQGRNHYKSNYIKNVYNQLLNKLVYQFSTSILSNSQAAINFFFPYKIIGDSRFEVISNGVNCCDYNILEDKEEIKKSLKIPNNKFIIGHVGRFDPAKNHQVILKVAREIIEQNKDVHFVFCGNGTEKIQTLVNDLKIEKYFTILGFRRDVPRVLKSFDLFFFPSITEGQPNSLIEAMVSGINFISSNIPPIKECVPASKHINLFSPDDVEGFKISIIKIIEKSNKNEESVKELMIHKYDSKTNFELFLKKIL